MNPSGTETPFCFCFSESIALQIQFGALHSSVLISRRTKRHCCGQVQFVIQVVVSFSWGSPSTVLVSTSPPGFLIRRGHLISWLRFLIRSGLCDSPDPDAESSSCQDSGSSFPILSSKCQLATAAPVTRSSILSSGAGASVVGPIALTDVSCTPVPKLYSSY